MDEVQAGARCWVTAKFFDKSREPVVPTSASYKVYCMTTSALIRDTTALTPAAEIEIEMDGTDTAMQSATKKKEIRKVCVTSEYGIGDNRLDNYFFTVVRPASCS